MTRDWTDAAEKVQREGCCRVCGSTLVLQAAHVIGRSHDRTRTGPRGGRRIVVEAIDVVPLCEDHHVAYDRRELDLLPYLTLEEQARAVELVGIASAMRRTTGERTAA